MPEGSATAKALDYSLKRWVALTRYLEDGAVPIEQPDRELDPAMGSWAQELALRRVATQRKTGSGDHKFDPICAAEWA